MPRFLIERVFSVDEAQMPAVSRESKRLAIEEFPTIVWEHSHVVSDDDGRIKSFCVYSAPDPQRLQDHADEVGFHRIGMIYQIGGDVSPSDFPD